MSCYSQVCSLRHRGGEERASALKQEAGAHRQGASGGRCAAHCLGGVRQRSPEPAQVNCACREPPAAGADSLTPITTRHVLTVVPADTILIDATAGVTEMGIGERMGAVNPPCSCLLLSVCCLRVSQARLRAVLRVRAPSMAHREPPFMLHAGMCGSWSAAGVARSAVATHARSLGGHWANFFSCWCTQISGPL